jgi:hypothetical protein
MSLLSQCCAPARIVPIVLLECPTNEAAAAWSLAIDAGGSVKASKTIPLLPVEEGREAMQQAVEATRYRPSHARDPIPARRVVHEADHVPYEAS